MRRIQPANPMPESRYEVLALFAGAMVAASLFVVSTGTLTPFLEAAFALPQSQLGLILSVQMVGSMLATGVAGALTDRFGDKAVVLWSGWFMGAALICAALVHDFHWVLLWLTVYGIGYAAVTPAGSHAIVFFFKREDRGFAMGVRQCGVPLAGVVGSAILPAIALHFDYQWALAAAGIITVATCSAASILYREPAQLRGERISLRAMFAEMLHIARDARLILMTLTSMALVCAQMVLVAFLTLTVVHEAHFGIPLAVGIFTLSQVAAVVGRMSWGWSSDKIFHGSRALPLAVVCVVTAAIVFGVAAFTPQTPVWAVAAAGSRARIFGGGMVWRRRDCFRGNRRRGAFGERARGRADGGVLRGIRFPTLFGALVEAHGYPFAWRALALLAFAGVVPALLASAFAGRFAESREGA